MYEYVLIIKNSITVYEDMSLITNSMFDGINWIVSSAVYTVYISLKKCVKSTQSHLPDESYAMHFSFPFVPIAVGKSC